VLHLPFVLDDIQLLAIIADGRQAEVVEYTWEPVGVQPQVFADK